MTSRNSCILKDNTSWYIAILDNSKFTQYEIDNLSLIYISRLFNNNSFRCYNTINLPMAIFYNLTYDVQPNYGFSNTSIQFNCRILQFKLMQKNGTQLL